jgi:FkbM family methyltransferase
VAQSQGEVVVKAVVRKIVGRSIHALTEDDRGLVTLTTMRGPARGLRFGLDLQDREEYAYWLGKYEPGVIARIAAVVKPGWTVWDCGTYLGYYTCFFARCVGPTGTVIAIEPDPQNLERTRMNVDRNGLMNVSFQPMAIAGRTEVMDLQVSQNTNSHLPGVYVGATRDEYRAIERVDATLEVQGTTLDDAWRKFDLRRPDLIKIDIEGAELHALAATTELARDVRPLIMLELHNPECDRAAWDWAQRSGYRLESLDTGQMIDRAELVQGTLLCRPPI